MARPRKPIDKNDFEKLCGLQCTKEEICAFLDVSDKTLDKWVKENYIDEDGNALSFSDVFRQKRGLGKISLRRKQWESAMTGNVTMQIWLGKNLLDQKDKQETMHDVSDNVLQLNYKLKDNE